MLNICSQHCVLSLFAEVPVDLELLFEHDLPPIFNDECVWIQGLGGSEDLPVFLHPCYPTELELQKENQIIFKTWKVLDVKSMQNFSGNQLLNGIQNPKIFNFIFWGLKWLLWDKFAQCNVSVLSVPLNNKNLPDLGTATCWKPHRNTNFLLLRPETTVSLSSLPPNLINTEQQFHVAKHRIFESVPSLVVEVIVCYTITVIPFWSSKLPNGTNKRNEWGRNRLANHVLQ